MFKASKDRINIKTYPTLLSFIRNPTTPVLLDQFSLTLEPFRAALTLLQARGATISSQQECLKILITSCLSKLGQSTTVDSTRHLVQFYKRDTVGSLGGKNFKPNVYKSKEGYSPLFIRTKSMSQYYEALPLTSQTAVKNKILRAREQLISELLKEVEPFSTFIFTRNAQLITKPVINITEASLSAISKEVPLIDTPKLIEEINELKAHQCAESLEKILDCQSELYPNLKLLNVIFKLVQPHNMEVERGFSQTHEILTNKRK